MEFSMNMWTAIVIIVIVTSIARVLRSKYQAPHGIVEDENGNQQFVARQADPAMQRELEDLRKRVAVLERITTDANKIEARQTADIARQIESLRDS